MSRPAFFVLLSLFALAGAVCRADAPAGLLLPVQDAPVTPKTLDPQEDLRRRIDALQTQLNALKILEAQQKALKEAQKKAAPHPAAPDAAKKALRDALQNRDLMLKQFNLLQNDKMAPLSLYLAPRADFNSPVRRNLLDTPEDQARVKVFHPLVTPQVLLRAKTRLLQALPVPTAK